MRFGIGWIDLITKITTVIILTVNVIRKKPEHNSKVLGYPVGYV